MRNTVGSWLVVVTGVFCWSCGAAPAREPAYSTTGQEETQYDESGQSGVSDPCRDGSCFMCGDAVCLPGYYCETIGEKKGCAWVAKCARSASCTCLQTALAEDSACSCEERDGNTYVTCSE